MFLWMRIILINSWPQNMVMLNVTMIHRKVLYVYIIKGGCWKYLTRIPLLWSKCIVQLSPKLLAHNILHNFNSKFKSNNCLYLNIFRHFQGVRICSNIFALILVSIKETFNNRFLQGQTFIFQTFRKSTPYMYVWYVRLFSFSTLHSFLTFHGGIYTEVAYWRSRIPRSSSDNQT